MENYNDLTESINDQISSEHDPNNNNNDGDDRSGGYNHKGKSKKKDGTKKKIKIKKSDKNKRKSKKNNNNKSSKEAIINSLYHIKTYKEDYYDDILTFDKIKNNDILFNITDKSAYKLNYYFERRIKKFKLDNISELDYINDLTNQKLIRRNKKINEKINTFRNLKLNNLV